ncbi:hypothetical protein, partial [Zavarzinella formosa]|uniref:hypothetical protein n=1 Tax=Zavarzinella formosa TaxID=360055 RepID=UPI001EE68765
MSDTQLSFLAHCVRIEMKRRARKNLLSKEAVKDLDNSPRRLLCERRGDDRRENSQRFSGKSIDHPPQERLKYLKPLLVKVRSHLGQADRLDNIAHPGIPCFQPLFESGLGPGLFHVSGSQPRVKSQAECQANGLGIVPDRDDTAGNPANREFRIPWPAKSTSFDNFIKFLLTRAFSLTTFRPLMKGLSMPTLNSSHSERKCEFAEK